MAEGKAIGRASNSGKGGQVRIRQLYRAGVSKAEIARQPQIGRTSVRRTLTDKESWDSRPHARFTQPCRKDTAGGLDSERYHAPREPGAMPEGKPTTKAAHEEAAHFLVRMVRRYPHEVTIYEGGSMTNLALAISIDPEFASLAKELVFMGASLSPQTEDPEFTNTPRREFKLWFDPEAAHIVLRAPGQRLSAPR